ncbi:acyltransferase family protein [Microbacterium sp. RD1]|uniref:acyltransferase family protein n=1 Tax=Microbacterium sp. RD1 TaxID=3457313 RepID=UPI003FA5EC4F
MADPVAPTRAAAPAHAAERGARKRAGTHFRPDIEGLRAVAVGTVLLYHAGIQFIPGGFVGVDIFFVISGFLITGLLVREVERTGRVSMARFYARRARRLLPAAVLVLVVSAALTWVTASPVDWSTSGTDIVAAALYVENWVLAARSVDYLAEGLAASPVQHYWSLSVEEQFYVVWPLVLLIVVLIVRKSGWNLRTVMGAALTLIVVPSLAWSVIATDSTPETAYFVTTTRLWELGVGALVAVSVGLWAKLPAIAARVVGWAGLAAILASVLLIDESARWPGSLALLPVLGTAAVIVAGTADQGGAARLLGLRPMVWVGGLSYSLYLWHWPLLIAAGNLFGPPGEKIGLAVIVISFVLAWLSNRFVENPVRFSKRLSRSSAMSLSVALNLTAVAVVSGLLLILAVPSAAAPSTEAIASRGGATLTFDADSIQGVMLEGALSTMIPAPAAATKDVPKSSVDGCNRGFDAVDPEPCSIGAADGDVTIAVVGDSKIQQWADVLGDIAREHQWRMLLATKSGCGFSDGLRELPDGVPYVACPQYNQALTEQLIELAPDVVITSQRHSSAFLPGTTEYSRDEMRDALVRTWTALEDHGIDVITVLDNPSPSDVEPGGGEVYKCVTEVDDLADCAFDRQVGLDRSGSVALLAAARKVPAIDVVDLTDAFCDETSCPPVIGDVLVYRQGSHLTNTYVRSLEPILDARLEPLVKAAAG